MTRDPRELTWQNHQRHEFTEPAQDLRPWVARYWAVEWDYPEPYRQLVVPYPNVQLTLHSDGAEVHGVSSGYVFKDLSGTGSVFGVAFHPGVFRPFLNRPVSTITDRTVPASTVFQGIPAAAGIEDFLRANLPATNTKATLAASIVSRVAAGPEIVRVDALASQFELTVRQLQRLFAEHVGVSPKWVIRRYRLHEVTTRMAAGASIDWAGLAADLGYADQAHFTRDFTAMFGESPTRYASRY
ncbi:MAG: helix-turn-helix domain-containing protein [Kibdelosporangium sp.]